MSDFVPKRPRLNDLHKRMMGDIKPFHSSAYANAAQGPRIGSTAPDPFSKRINIEKNRQHVGSYRDAMASQAPSERRSTGLTQTPRTSSSTKQSFNSMPPRQAFREPPTRGFNPFS